MRFAHGQPPLVDHDTLSHEFSYGSIIIAVQHCG